MKYQSASTQEIDAFRAGIELGESLEGIHPEIVLLFCSVSYEPFTQLILGLREGLQNNHCLIIGGTGDGIFESALVADQGCCALGIASDGKIKWHVEACDDASLDTYRKAESCLLALKKAAKTPLSLVMAFADFHEDGTELVRAINEHAGVPGVGGFVSDDRNLHKAYIFAGEKVLNQGMALLGIEGPLPFVVKNGSGWVPKGSQGSLTEVQGTKVHRIADKTAVAFIEQETGKSISFIDTGNLSFYVSDQEDKKKTYLRAMSSFSLEDGSITLFGKVALGSKVQVCVANSEDIVNGVKEVVSELRKDAFIAKAGLIVSCAGRKWVLGNDIAHEVRLVQEAMGQDLPLVGFPSLGEISPVKIGNRHQETFFHNVTYVLLLFGDF